MKKSSLLAVVILVLASIAFGSAQQSSSNQNMPTGKAFIDKVAQINLGEVELGKLAQQKGNNPAVKDFARRMIQDHTQAEDDLQQLAKQESVTLPSQPGAEASSLHHLRNFGFTIRRNVHPAHALGPQGRHRSC